ncbi:MAG: RluA family pseudouridine synthase [Patescibacteria group bacterium]
MEFISDKTGERLDKFLAAHYTGISRSQFQKLINEGTIKINGKAAKKPAILLRKGDRVLILEEEVLRQTQGGKEFIVEPEPDIPLEIIYEDSDIVVINKTAGLLVHPTLSQKKHTLANALIARYPEMKNVGESPMRPGIVHRLDKDTSGVIVATKNQAAFLYMKDQFLKRGIYKKYLALVEGIPKEKEGVIEYDIRPSKTNRLKKVAVKSFDKIWLKKSRRTAKTAYKVIKNIGDKFSLIEVSPVTGRTHQIRVHLAAIGHPIVGDRMYGSKAKSDTRYVLKRQFLHAFSLEFTAPNGKKLSLETKLPEDLNNLIKNLNPVA